MSAIKQLIVPHDWSSLQLTLFRIFFIFLLLLTIPLDPAYYQRIFAIDIFHLRFQDFFQLSTYVPRLIQLSAWGIASFAGWGIAFLVALAGAVLWQALEKNTERDYLQWYYWLRVIVRYRLALGLIGYGIIKLIPVQIPTATISDLHTAYGDFLPWKIYYLSTGVSSAYYEPTLGAIEIFAGLLLFSTRTTVVGAAIAASLLINIVLVNFAYQIGEHVYSVYLLLLASFLLAYDTPRLYQLLVKERTAAADVYKPKLYSKGLNQYRKPFKILLLVFTMAYGLVTYHDYKTRHWPFPETPGLTHAAGVYNVKEFKLNNQVLPYSASDTTRWKDVVFEKWNVLSIGANKKFPINLHSARVDYQDNEAQNYATAGNGGRGFYSYTVKDSTIRLQNTNRPGDVITFRLSRPSQSTIILTGINSSKDSLHIVLEKLNKEYLLNKGRRKPVQVL